MVKRIPVGFGIDVDANGSAADPTDASCGIFGANVGVDRLLKLWERYDIKTTWFIPGHHRIVPKTDSETTSKRSIKLLEEFGLEHDHSFMFSDSQLHYAPNVWESWKETNYAVEAADWMVQMTRLQASKIVETMPSHCPQWSLDDWPPFQVEKGSSLGYVDTHSIERLWREQFDFLYKEYKQFVFPISSIHPQVSGKPQVILMLRRFIEYFKTHEGMEWCTFEKMVEEGALKKVPCRKITNHEIN
ncbi:hypothetical protein K432DRAFT_414616 [Lepidopterella palustris CBS 459.81]|uniref:NodB homology domain-containing protein n=1 Tax=Lepidopterella palustris CBS 459.81 TaxID=1314670 RepID=A0A8E2EGA5_9PEZI|nr:hypothetical protein K432DRAFT_414616 [Lepidopterella palustris CBS 459.81]